MKRLTPLLCISLFSCALLGQVAFAPVGATWAYIQSCPQVPFDIHYNFIVTKDTIIQGKYCTQLEDVDWPCWSSVDSRVFVHQDGQKVYRYDFDNEEFQLVFDFSKGIGESWTAKTCPGNYGDTVTVTVKDTFPNYRYVDVTRADGSILYKDLELSEYFGAYRGKTKLLLATDILDDCSYSLNCYFDPIEGLISGNCSPDAVEDKPKQSIVLHLSPNPTSDIFNVQFLTGQPTKASSFRIVNYEGRVLKELQFSPAQNNYSFPVGEYAPGIYALLLMEEGRVVAVERFLVGR